MFFFLISLTARMLFCEGSILCFCCSFLWDADVDSVLFVLSRWTAGRLLDSWRRVSIVVGRVYAVGACQIVIVGDESAQSLGVSLFAREESRYRGGRGG